MFRESSYCLAPLLPVHVTVATFLGTNRVDFLDKVLKKCPDISFTGCVGQCSRNLGE